MTHLSDIPADPTPWWFGPLILVLFNPVTILVGAVWVTNWMRGTL